MKNLLKALLVTSSLVWANASAAITVVEINKTPTAGEINLIGTPGMTFFSSAIAKFVNTSTSAYFNQDRVSISSAFYPDATADQAYSAGYASSTQWISQGNPRTGSNGVVLPSSPSVFAKHWMAIDTNTVNTTGEMKGWLSFYMDSAGNVTMAEDFVYDPTTTITLAQAKTAVAPVLAPVPEISGSLITGVALLVGGLSYRRRSGAARVGADLPCAA